MSWGGLPEYRQYARRSFFGGLRCHVRSCPLLTLAKFIQIGDKEQVQTKSLVEFEMIRSIARELANGIFARPPLPARRARRFARVPRIQLSTFLPAAALLALWAAGRSANATTINFEGVPDSTILTTQYPGLTFSNTIILTSGISLNEFEFPPHSGVNVASDDNGPITIDFSTPIMSFGAYFTYLEPLTIDAFNASDTEVATATSAFSDNDALFGDPGSSPNEFIDLSFAGGISSVTITGDPLGSSFTMDDTTYETGSTTVPEPSTTILTTAGIAFLAAIFTRKKNRFAMKLRTLIPVLIAAAAVLVVGGLLYATEVHNYVQSILPAQTGPNFSEQILVTTATGTTMQELQNIANQSGGVLTGSKLVVVPSATNAGDVNTVIQKLLSYPEIKSAAIIPLANLD